MKQNNPQNRQRLMTIGIAAFLAIVLLYHLVTFQVRVTEVTVVTTFGKPTRAISEPGLYWKWPYPFQDYFPFDSRIQVFSGKLEQTYTKDDKNIIIETYVGWRILDPIKFLSRAGTYKNAQKSLEALLRNYANGVMALYSFSNLVSEKAKEIKISEIESKVLKYLNDGVTLNDQDQNRARMEGVKESLGIVVEIFGVKQLELPESTTKEVFARMKEERNRIVQSYQSQGEGEAKKIRAEADAIKEKMIIEATAQATIIRGQGDALAANYYKKFEQNRGLAIWLRKLDSLQKLLSQNKKITLILDTKTPPFDLLHEKNLHAKQEEIEKKNNKEVKDTNKKEVLEEKKDTAKANSNETKTPDNKQAPEVKKEETKASENKQTPEVKKDEPKPTPDACKQEKEKDQKTK